MQPQKSDFFPKNPSHIKGLFINVGLADFNK